MMEAILEFRSVWAKAQVPGQWVELFDLEINGSSQGEI